MKKPVPGFPSIYASDCGKVFRGEEQLTCYADDVGQPALSLKRDDGVKQKIKAATLVARAFLDLAPGVRCRIEYADGDPWNLAVHNLVLQDSSRSINLPDHAKLVVGEDGVAAGADGSIYEKVGEAWRRCTTTVSDGYLIVQVRVNGQGQARVRRVNNLVARAFHGAPPEGRPYACHDNGIRTDNRPENLYWGTPGDNALDFRRHNNSETKVVERTHAPTRVRPMGEQHTASKVTSFQVLELRRGHQKLLMANVDMRRAVGLSEAAVYRILAGIDWKHLLPLQDEHNRQYGDRPINLGQESNGTTHEQ
jgi:hypothetical protein